MQNIKDLENEIKEIKEKVNLQKKEYQTLFVEFEEIQEEQIDF
ncbi:unnamed protein product [Paramecium sonneborni]|uniref:Uncharacterized protein n=1 Tax=Paramecium sonneborni TaxID=65129 RepID=A0A8S1PTA8_9CILI|nr:unnamed protein product [Paramecium sonneborni]